MTDSNKPDHSASFADIWAILAEVAAQHRENAARQAENAAQIAKLVANSEKTDNLNPHVFFKATKKSWLDNSL